MPVKKKRKTRKPAIKKKPARKKASRRKKKKKTSLKSLFFKLLLLLTILSSAVVYTIYYSVDLKVEKILKRPNHSSNSAILSHYTKINSSKILTKKDLLDILRDRGYIQAKSKAKNPGEFYINEDFIDINVREFISNRGKIEESKIYTYNLIDGNIYSKNNSTPVIFIEPKTISSLAGGDRRESKFISLGSFPDSLKKAVTSIEDERFYNHFGIDLIGISRAMLVNIKNMKYLQGGSTITQQLAKNLLFSPKKTLSRKAKEALASISLERRLSKNKILELYLNEVYLGQEGSTAIHGMSAASNAFFNKHISKLSLSESALLAGLIKAPSYYSPSRNIKNALKRRNIVLDKMYEKKIITLKELTSAKNYKITIKKGKSFKSHAPYYAQALKTTLKNDLGLDEINIPGLQVHTGINFEIQNCAEKAITNGLDNLQQTYFPNYKQKLSAGLVAMEPYSGLVKAWVGGKDYTKKQFDHVSQANRQIGSTVKPFVYLTALDSSLNDYRVATPATLLADKPMEIEVEFQEEKWTPENYDHDYRDVVTLRYALEKSLNLPAVYIGQKMGVDKIAATVDAFEIAKNPLAVPSLMLGAVETTLLKLTSAYAALANGGILVKPRLYISAVDRSGEIILKSNIEEKRVASPSATYVLTNMMQGVVERGSAAVVRRLGFDYQAAGKTGTTNDARDAWFVGFTPRLVAGVWVGFDDNAKVGLAGSSAAAPIWTDFMKCSSKYFSDSKFIPPSGVTFKEIDSRTGLMYYKRCRGIPINEVFVKGTEPKYYCDETPVTYESDDEKPFRQRPNNQNSIWKLLFG